METTTSNEVSECPDGWSRMDTSCYWLSFEEVDWVKAQNGCLSLNPNAHLASSGSKSEDEFILSLRPSSAEPHHLWLGGSDFKEEGHWVWSDGTPFGYTNWGDNEGSHGPGQNCIAMETHTPSTSIPRGKWHDLGCFDSHPFVCEIDLNISWNL